MSEETKPSYNVPANLHSYSGERLHGTTEPGMDRRIVKNRFNRKTFRSLIIAFTVFIAGYYFVDNLTTDRSLKVMGNRLNISKVIQGTFEDFIPLRAQVAPLKTVFLDAVQGGRIEEILLEDGATVEVNQIVLRLSSSDLQLSVMSTESRVIEQLNAMRTQELKLEQNRTRHKHALVDLDYNIRRLTRESKRRKELIDKSLISQSEYDDFVDELNYSLKKRDVTLESQASDENLMAAQLRFFKEKTVSMEENLTFARASLNNLIVRSPVAGRLSGFDMEIGQNVPRGLRIGQVSNPTTFKLLANIDEFYLGRVNLDQEANFERNGKHYILRVTKIYPDVQNGQFQIDLKMTGDQPSNLRRGQTLQSKLILGDSDNALLIPNGQFFQDTGGEWVFVINSMGTEAIKREIRLGRRNNRFIEVLSGLEPGETVITSSYESFREMDKLVLKKES